MHLTLYRKYRPQTFDEVIGQDHITRTLYNQVKSGKIGHAYLFSGSRGTGKTSTARIFARAINCESKEGNLPCYKCATCKALAEPTNLDIVEIDAASNNRVDEIREIRDKIKFLPTNGKYKVYIIDEVHMLTDSAFNALLKTLEEPPEHVVFILGTTEIHKLPATILSRCMRFDFKLVSTAELASHLKNIFQKENISYDDKAIDVIVTAAEGSVRDMLSIADSIVSFSNGNVSYDNAVKILGTSDTHKLVDFADKIITKDVGGAFEEINKVVLSGKNISVFAKETTIHFRNLLVAKTAKSAKEILNMPIEDFELIKAQSEKESAENLMFYMKTFSEIEAELKYSMSPRTLVEVATVKAIEGLEELKKNEIWVNLSLCQAQKLCGGKL